MITIGLTVQAFQHTQRSYYEKLQSHNIEASEKHCKIVTNLREHSETGLSADFLKIVQNAYFSNGPNVDTFNNQ